MALTTEQQLLQQGGVLGPALVAISQQMAGFQAVLDSLQLPLPPVIVVPPPPAIPVPVGVTPPTISAGDDAVPVGVTPPVISAGDSTAPVGITPPVISA